MRFRIGPWSYRVRIAREELKDEHGTKASALCDRLHEVIWISAALQARHRLKRLIHELRHAWALELGTPADPEGDADSVSSFCVDMMRQLTLQGGEMALMRLTSDGVVDETVGPTDVPSASYCIECKCGQKIASGCVQQGELDLKDGVATIARAAWCDHCGHWICWNEIATPSGLPSGRVIAVPEYSKTLAQRGRRTALTLCG